MRAPGSNTGVRNVYTTEKEHEIISRFDWYQATVPAHHELVIQRLQLAAPHLQRINGKGAWNYLACASLVHGSNERDVFCRVYHGGPNGHPNVSATSDDAPVVADTLRREFPAHRVSRLDVAIDVQGDGLFDDLVRVMGRVGRQHRVKGEKIIPDDLDDGSTYYLGSRKSSLRVRCYEKGKELLKKTGDPVWRNFFDWTRLELQVRPEKNFKAEAALMPPEAFWGCAAWTRSIVEETLAMNPEPVAMKPTRLADHERAMRALTSQYGHTIRRQVQLVGGWDAFLMDLRSRLGDDDSDDLQAA